MNSAVRMRIQEARQGKYSQQEMAQRLGMSISNFQKYDRGKVKHISLEIIDKICDLLGCEISDLLVREK